MNQSIKNNVYLCGNVKSVCAFLNIENSFEGVKNLTKKNPQLNAHTFKRGFPLLAGHSLLPILFKKVQHARTKGSAPCLRTNVTVVFSAYKKLKLFVKGKEGLICIRFSLKSENGNSLNCNTTLPPHETKRELIGRRRDGLNKVKVPKCICILFDLLNLLKSIPGSTVWRVRVKKITNKNSKDEREKRIENKNRNNNSYSILH